VSKAEIAQSFVVADLFIASLGEFGMAKIEPFEKYVEDYDEWFNKNYDWYDAELNAIRCFIPEAKLKGMEVGVGTGRFAQPLGINLAIEPSMQMLKKAKQRGIQGCLAVAEALPFSDKVFDFVLMVTTICFIDNVKQSFQEVYRVLKPEGFFLVGFVDKESKLGQHYLKKKKQSRFYQEATFFSVSEVQSYFEKTGFQTVQIKQTLIPDMPTKTIMNGYGKGSFVVIKAVKQVKG